MVHHQNRENIRILNRVRLIAINGQVALILFSIWYFDVKLTFEWLAGIIAFEILFEIYSFNAVNREKVFTTSEVFFHIVIDSIILAGLIYFSGGANNPFIYLLLLFVALASFMLTRRYLLVMVIIQLSLYSLLNLYQKPLQLAESSPLNSFHLHLAGMWVNFILSVILIAIFGLLTRKTLLQQEKKIQHLREKQLQDEQILGLGIMSAGAAHELGTPLSTMAIVIDDLLHMESSNDIKDDLNLIAAQINQCKSIIGALGDRSRLSQHQVEQETNTPLIHLKAQLIRIFEHWLVYRPKINLQIRWENFENTFHYDISISLEQAITNLLDNAADASLANNNNHIDLLVTIIEHNLVLNIFDFGKGILPEKKFSLGRKIQNSDKENGLGWGMLLSNVSVERAGGKVQLVENKQGGILTKITIPIDNKKGNN